jgi:quercetin dioxygenase-like cupin family protein
MTYGGSSWKRSEVGCQRRGSNPARQNLGKKPIQGAPRFSPYRPLFAICYLRFAICATRSVMSQPLIERKELLIAVLRNGVFTSADVREIRLQPGQQSGRHLHPCAVLGYILKGTATYQIEGEAEQILPAGSAFHEPAGAIIANFGNASDSEPMTFVAFYLLNGDQELIQMLE